MGVGVGGEHLCRSVYVRASVVNRVIYTSITLPGILGGSMCGFNYHTLTKHRWAALPSSKHRSLCICFSHYLDVHLSVMISDSGHMIHQEDVCSADMWGAVCLFNLTDRAKMLIYSKSLRSAYYGAGLLLSSSWSLQLDLQHVSHNFILQQAVIWTREEHSSVFISAYERIFCLKKTN